MKVHFIGIGGVGMSGLANILLDLGEEVSGSDMEVSFSTRRLKARGARIAVGHAEGNVPEDTDVVVYSSAVPENNPERAVARARGIRAVRRGLFLADLAERFACVISVAGSHGKTTTSAMLAHILKQCGWHCGYLVGGDVVGWPVSASAGAGRILVTEVDESDGTQEAMRSTVAVVTNVEDDHCWSVGGEEALLQCFATFARRADAVLCWDTPQTRALFDAFDEVGFFSDRTIPCAVTLPQPGVHNRRNAALAIAAAERVGVQEEDAVAALRTFPGVKRRFTCHYRSREDRVVLIEDYAHHPTELRCLMETLADRWPRHRQVVVFQPHRFERVKRYAEEFSETLGRADQVVVTSPFAAWTADGEQARPQDIAAGIADAEAMYWDGEYAPLAERLLQNALAADALEQGSQWDGTVFAVVGAGSVRHVIPPLRERLVRHELAALCRALRAKCPEMAVTEDSTWGALTTLGIGGACPLVAHPASVDDLRRVLSAARERAVAPFVVGRGSNLVGTDSVETIVAIRLDKGEFRRVDVDAATVSVGAGVSLHHLCRVLLDAQRLPPEWAPLAWIPGSIGGAVRMNAGADGVSMVDVAKRLEGIDADGATWRADARDIEWGYRAAAIPESVILCRVELDMPEGKEDAAAARAAYVQSGERRRTNQPGEPSAGCVFRNAGEAGAGALVDRCGCKGWREAGCRVSEIHANFLIRDGEADEADFMDLLLRVRFAVFEQSGILLHPEVRFVHPESQERVEHSIAPLRAVVLEGGPSAERPISLKSGAAVAGALRDAGVRVDQIDLAEASIPDISGRVDAVVPMLHGTFGEDGQLQQLLEERGLPLVGSDSRASALIMDKARTKELLTKHGLRTPQACRVATAEAPLPDLRFPIIVKPCNQGSSLAIARLNEPEEKAWRHALDAAFAVDAVALAEEFVAGCDLTIALLDGIPLPAIEIRPPSGRMYDFDAKYEYTRGHTEYFCPPKTLSDATVGEAEEMAKTVYRILGARHLLRVDFRADEQGRCWILEANTIPGFTGTSLFPKAARAAGISFPELCVRLVRMAQRSA